MLKPLPQRFSFDEQQMLNAPGRNPHTSITTSTQPEHDLEQQAIRTRVRHYLETDSQRRFRYAQWAALILSLVFISGIVVTLAIICVRVNSAFDSIGGATVSEKAARVMDLAVEGADNARLATRNVLHVTEYARTTASLAAPQLQRAVNSTNALVDDLRSWSFHPSLSIAPGAATG